MIRVTALIASLLAALALGCAGALLISHHPLVASVDLGKDTSDAKSALTVCRLYASWPVELKPGEHLTLERRICPVEFHKNEDDTDWVSPVQHEVLLLEDRRWWKTQIVAVLFSDLDFTQVEVGKTLEGRDAILWSYFIKCGSCHGGPIGVLAWSNGSNAYRWNEDWFDAFSKAVQAKLPDDAYADTPPTLAWENLHKELGYDNAVYGPHDANCCPSAGRIIADFVVKDGTVTLQGQVTYLPS